VSRLPRDGRKEGLMRTAVSLLVWVLRCSFGALCGGPLRNEGHLPVREEIIAWHFF
jgi:hypothetical protein